MAEINLFSKAGKKDIRVGYISTDRGYVSNVSIYEANKYAKLEPGTQFIVSNRDEVRYLNINEVNALTVESVLPKSYVGNCADIKGLEPNINLEDTNKVEVNFLGGGGIGAQANAIVGNDGSILAVDVIHPGFGYKYPPLVEIKDTFGKASKVNARAFLGETATLLETYTDKNEFENLDFETLIPNFDENDYGVRLDPVNGEVIGDWNPNDYANYLRDPIRSEILKYQEFVQRKSVGTWWDSRTQRPIVVVGENKNNNIIFPVEHWTWGGELIKPEKITGFVPVEFEIFGQGSQKNRDLEFKFEAEDGSHSFTVKGITKRNQRRQIQIQGKSRKAIKKVRVNTTYIVTSNRRNKIKNVDRAIEQGLVRESGGKSIERGEGTGKVVFADYVDSRNDNDDMQLTAKRGKFKSSNKRKIEGREGAKDDGETRKKNTYDLTYRLNFRDPTKRNPIEVVNDDFMNKYAISPVPASDAEGSAHVGKVYTLVWKEYFPYDGEYTFNALSDSFSNITFSNSEGTLWDFKPRQIKGIRGQKARKERKIEKQEPKSVTKFVKEGLYTITASLENNGDDPIIETIVTPPMEVNQPKEITRPTETEPAEVEYKIAYIGLNSVNNKLDVSSNRKLIKFLDEDGDDGNAHLEILSGKAVFSKDGNEIIGSGKVKVEFRWNDNPSQYGIAVKQVQIISGGSDEKVLGSNRNFSGRSKDKGSDTQTLTMESSKDKSTDESKSSSKDSRKRSPFTIFDTMTSINKADRKLYKAKPILGKKFSNFFNKYAVLPFDPQGEKITRTQTIEVEKEKPIVSFDTDEGNIYLKVSGSGRVKVDFKLKVDDNLITSGLALREVSIENDGDLLKLVRNIRGENTYTRGVIGATGQIFRGDERETITGSAEFTAGKRYLVKQIGGSPTSGFKSIDKTTVGFDDDINDGYDKNGEIEITNVKIIEQENTINTITTTNVSSDSYAGEHLIRWEKIEFPQDGNYAISAAADDSARILIGNVSGKGKMKIGNGLRNRDEDGDEYIIEVNSNGTKSGPKRDIAFFNKGRYRIRVELTQKRGKTLLSGNPMGIAIEIKTASTEQQVEVDNFQSWQENPMGLALTIKAPKAPVPKETPPPQLGRCPNNPMWTTRFRTGEDKWYPVYDNRWGTFMNRFAMSPVKPKSSPESSRSGEEFTKTWSVDIPYDGFYGVRGACDNTGTITIGGNTFNLAAAKKELPKLRKVFLEEGNVDISITVANTPFKSFIKKPKIIFDTADWVETAEEIDVDIITEKMICHAGGGFGGNPGKRQDKVGKVKLGKGGNGAPGEGEQDGNKGGNGGGSGLKNGGTAKTGKGGTIDGGFGVNLEGSERGNNDEVRSDDDDGGDGASYGGGGGGSRGQGRAGNGGGGAIKIIWGSTGKSVTYTKPGLYEVLVPQTEPGKLNRTSVRVACIGGGGAGFTDRAEKATEVVTGRGEGEAFYYDGDGNRRTIKIDTEVKERMVKGGGGGSGGAYAYNTERLVAGTRLEIVVGRGGVATTDEGSSDGEDSYVKVLTTVIDKEADKPRKMKNPQGKGSIKYTGPLITSYRKKGIYPKHLGPYLSPFFAFGRQATDEIQGREWKFKWENVDFPIDGTYTFRTEADDKMVVRIDGRKVVETRVEENLEERTRKFTAGKKTVEITLENSNQPGTNFVLNPVYCGLEILAQVRTETNDQSSWKKNPVGASAMLIPPPCPQEIGGIGVIDDVEITTPGVGYTGGGGPGYPVILKLKQIIIENEGINYKPGDPIIITDAFDDDDTIDIPPNTPIVPVLPVSDDGSTTTPPGGGGTPGPPGDGSSLFTGTPQEPGGTTTITTGPGDSRIPGDSGTTGTTTVPGDSGTTIPIFDPNVPGPPEGSDGGDRGGPGGGGPGTGTGTGTGLIGGPQGSTSGFSDGAPGSGVGAPAPGSGIGAPGSGIGAPGSGVPGAGRRVTNTGNRNPILNLVLGPFGTVVGVDVVDPGAGFTRTPTISILSNTGVNAVLRPKFEVVRDPIGVDPETLIQVTDLVGLKQTGYINGRAYYGQVFIKNGLRYAGVYETVGELVRVYDTLQESITREVITRPSAILRQGTDIRSNDPRLNIPGTPDNLS